MRFEGAYDTNRGGKQKQMSSCATLCNVRDALALLLLSALVVCVHPARADRFNVLFQRLFNVFN